MWAMMHISPLFLWNKANIMFKSNSSSDKIFVSHSAISKDQTQDPGYCFWMTALTLSWRHLLCSWVSIVSHCPLSKLLLLKTGSAEKILSQKFIARLQLRFHFLQWTLFFPPSASPWQCLKVQISSLKAKMIHIFRDQTPPSLKSLFSAYTVISGAFPPVTINYMPLSIIKLILLILATKSKRLLNRASLDALKLKLLMCNRWLM